MALAAVMLDVGGVVTESPLAAIARFERSHGLPPGAINRAAAGSGPAGAWARLERGQLTLEAFYGAFEADCRAHGLVVDARGLMACVQAAGGAVRPRMLEAIGIIRARGLRVAALTNNWHGSRAGGLAPHFDVFVESRLVGLRKPDPRIYALACGRLGVEPARVAFLDDIGANLKPARALGMVTIKVEDPDVALAELGTLLGFPLSA